MVDDVEKRSPLKAPPLRHAGQSLEAQIEDLVLDKSVPWLMVIALVVYTAAMNWVQYLLSTPELTMCVIWTVAAAIAIPFAARRVRRNRKKIESLKLGRDGERIVAQYLDEYVVPHAYRVLNDVVERDGEAITFNIDHVLIGPGGVFVLETKTRSKPTLGEPVVEYDGARVRVDGGPWDEAPIRQAKANAAHVRRILEETTGRRDVRVRAVLLFPGWWIEGTSSGKDVWVLEPKALPGWLEQERPGLAREDAALYASRLAGHVRLLEKR